MCEKTLSFSRKTNRFFSKISLDKNNSVLESPHYAPSHARHEVFNVNIETKRNEIDLIIFQRI
jgi:hypothetical protein